MQTLSDIQIALKVIGGGDKGENPIDHHYHGLNCTLTPVDHEDVVFELVEKYVRQTHAKYHSGYQLKVQEVFEVARQGEAENFKDMGNRYTIAVWSVCPDVSLLHCCCIAAVHWLLHCCCTAAVHWLLHCCCTSAVHWLLHCCCTAAVHWLLHYCCTAAVHWLFYSVVALGSFHVKSTQNK